MSPARRRTVLLRGGLLLLALVIGLWHPGRSTDLGAAIEGRLLDLRFVLRGPVAAPDGVAIVLIDDADLAAIGGFPPPRAALAEAVDRIAARGAAAIALDLLLIDARPGDAALAAALARAPGVVVAVARAPSGMTLRAPDGAGTGPALAGALRRSGFDAVIGMPAAFAGVARGPTEALAPAVRLGHVNVRPGADGAVRGMPAAVALVAGDGVETVPGLALAALRAADPEARLVLRGATGRRDGAVGIGEARVPLGPDGVLPLVPYGPAGSFATYPLREIARAPLAGRVVFLGLAGTGVGDRHTTAFDRALPGVALHATLAANLLEGRHLRRDRTAWLIDIAACLVLAAAGLAAAARRTPAGGVLAGAGCGALLVGGLQGGLLLGWWLDAVTLTLALVAVTGIAVAARALRSRRQAANLARYGSPLLAEALSESDRPAFEGRAQQAVALFVDVTGSTARAEALGPDGAGRFLAGFQATVARAADEAGGVVEQFTGDGAMIIFGLPEARASDPDAALGCIAALCAETARAEPPLPIRVGAHLGRVQAAVLGGARQRHVTITGDTVNAASRLQEVARDEARRVVVSDTLLQASAAPRVWAERLGLTELGLRPLRGRAAHLHVWAGPGQPVAPPDRDL